jgi:hypothetical protein
MIYEKLAEREKKENQVPASLKALINTMPNTNLIGGGNE